ncbi:hypothetical protein Tco_1404702 [Tanacetum coccineum]
MEKVRNTSATLRSCLKGSQIRNIDGKIVGKDGKPMMPMRHETSNGGTVHEETVTVTKSLKDDTDRTFFEAWEDPNVGAMKTTYGNDAHESNENPNLASKRQGSFADVLNNNPSSKSKFRSLLNSEKVENADVVLPLATFTAAQQRYANSLVGYFVGKNVAFPLVQNYVSNTWSKFGFQKVIKDEDGFFFFKFTSLSGLEQVLEQGPWLIRNIPIILTKWSPNLALTKDKVTKVPVWVKMHKVPVVAYSEDGLSLIATQIGKPVMLDAFTSTMCADPWGRMGYARALIEVSAEKELKQEVIMAVPEVEGTGHIHVKIQVEYEWKPPLCHECHVFGHNLEQCPKHVVEPVKVTVEQNTDGFTTVTNRKKKGKQPQSNHARKIEGLKLNKPKATFVYRPKISEPARTMETTSDDIDLFKLKNQFDSLRDQDDLLKENEVGETSGANAMNKDTNLNEDSESDVEEVGLNRTPKQSEVRQVVNENRLSICAILESHVDISALSKVCSKVFRSWDWTSNASLCSKGCRIILGWNLDVVNVMVVSQTSQVMHVKIIHKVSGRELFCSFVYANNLPVARRSLWADLELHKNVTRGKPWILMGDFNVALNLEDYSSGSSKLNYAITDFKDCVYNIEVMDINSSGLHFTWNQKPKGGSGLLKKLDRIMGNTEFIDAFPGAYALFQPYRISDHSPAMYQVVSKLKALKKPFLKLLHDQGNLHDRVNKLRFELDEVQKALDLNPNDLSLREEEVVYVQAFSEAKLDEERFLKQKAKIEWLEVGDSNSAYFHKSVKIRIHRGRIDVIMNSDNIEVTGSNVADVFVSRYQMFLRSDMVCDNLNMDAAMFSIGDERAPRPDGFSSAFFKKGWDIVGLNVCHAIRDFFVNGRLLKEINHTFIALIPKVSTPLKINDYRPISCCNVIYKCISKILTNRIIDGIKEVVSDNQSAFVPGRRISDNILITQELMHNYHRNRGPPRCAFKIDIQKAYDTVDWRFLGCVLKYFGFHPLMIKWIMACVTSTSFSLNLNGDIHGFFKGKRGLRQGDPLSPYLFTLIMEVLTLMIKRRVNLSGVFRYHKNCEELQLVNVCFADDLFIFARGDLDSARVIMESLDEFKLTSGLVPSIPKSTAFFCNVPNHVKISILNIMPFAEGNLPVKYLGVPLISSRLLNKDCKVLVEKAKNRIEDWKNKSLSFAGRLQLCKSVISSLHVYWASVLIIPKGIIYDIQSLIRGFLWCNGEYKRGKAKVAWDDICLPKSEGGLGLRSLDLFNMALMTTHIWNIVSNKESLWVRWIHTYKLRNRSFWDLPIKDNVSWGWLKLLQLRVLVRPFFSSRAKKRSNYKSH